MTKRNQEIANDGYHRDRAIAAAMDGRADFVSGGAPFIANPCLAA